MKMKGKITFRSGKLRYHIKIDESFLYAGLEIISEGSEPLLTHEFDPLFIDLEFSCANICWMDQKTLSVSKTGNSGLYGVAYNGRRISVVRRGKTAYFNKSITEANPIIIEFDSYT